MQSQLHTHSPEKPGRSRLLPGLLVGAGVVAVGVVGVLLATGGSDPDPAGDALRLSMPEDGGAMASCLPLTTEYLAQMTPAFAGTVTAVGDETVSLRVDRWYAGGDASEVVLAIPPGAHAALIGEIDFREGKEYLITASDGMVNMCGYSGEATPELQQAFDAAF